MISFYHRWVLSHLQNMPMNGTFLSRELHVHINGAVLSNLRDKNFIEVVGRYKHVHIWAITTRGRQLLRKHPYRVFDDLPRRAKYLPESDTPRYLDEVRNYLKSNPGAKVFDVALELHFGDNHAARLLKIISEESKPSEQKCELRTKKV